VVEQEELLLLMQLKQEDQEEEELEVLQVLVELQEIHLQLVHHKEIMVEQDYRILQV
jgi:hypothetical protein